MKPMIRFVAMTLCVLLVSLTPAAHAMKFHPALELEGGASTITLHTDSGTDTDGIDPKYGPLFGVGVTVGGDPAARFGWRTGVAYRFARSRWEFDDTVYPVAYRSTTRTSTLRVPVRASFAPVAGGHWRVEGGLTARYLLKATQDIEMPDVFIRRRAVAGAVIFESIGGERDVTEFMRRGDVLLSVGAGWRGRVSGHDAALTARFEQGLYDLALGEPSTHQAERSVLLGLSIGWLVAD